MLNDGDLAPPSVILSFSGTTNSMVQVLPTARLDLLLNVDTWEMTAYKTDKARAACEMGEQDRSFVRYEG